jgi:enamine deaminase RidA (YjgF/YER057c/UK114 family)
MSQITRTDVGSRFSEAAVFQNVVYLAGQVPSNSATGKDIRAQTIDVLDQIDSLLARCGSNKSNILMCTVYLTNIERDYAGMNEVYEAWLKSDSLNPIAPPRATVEVVRLANVGWDIEIVVTAAQIKE